MSLSRLLRTLAEKRRLTAALKARLILREKRSDAARRGHSTEWKRRSDECRAMFGGN